MHPNTHTHACTAAFRSTCLLPPPSTVVELVSEHGRETKAQRGGRLKGTNPAASEMAVRRQRGGQKFGA